MGLPYMPTLGWFDLAYMECLGYVTHSKTLRIGIFIIIYLTPFQRLDLRLVNSPKLVELAELCQSWRTWNPTPKPAP